VLSKIVKSKTKSIHPTYYLASEMGVGQVTEEKDQAQQPEGVNQRALYGALYVK